MADFYVTFGQQYPREPHPVWPYAHRDGWVRIVAPDERTARGVAIARLGQKWSMLYAAREFAGDQQFYPLGELAVATVAADGATWDDSRGEALFSNPHIGQGLDAFVNLRPAEDQRRG